MLQIYMSEKVGVAFAKKKTTASTSKTVPKVKRLKTGEAYLVVPKYRPSPKKDDVKETTKNGG